MELVDDVIKDIHDYIAACDRIHFNERDLQIRLAMYLRDTGRYADVDVEYYVPQSVFGKGEYIWNTEMKVDIVVERAGEYLPIELKYKTQTTDEAMTRFGEYVGHEQVLKNQAAQNLGKYDFWKDVRRVELLKRRFKAVHSGVVLFLTNDKSYTATPRQGAACGQFAMNPGTHTASKHWTAEAKTTQGRPDFNLDKGYSLRWHSPKLAHQQFYYTIVQV